MNDTEPLYQLNGQIGGRKVTIRLWPDRLEWGSDRGVSGGKVALGVLTYGLSLLATGVKGNKDNYIAIPVTAITGVTITKNGMSGRLVQVQNSSRQAIEFAVTRGAAEEFKQAIHHAIQMNTGQPVLVAPTIADQIQQLTELYDAGILTETEYETKKAELLERL